MTMCDIDSWSTALSRKRGRQRHLGSKAIGERAPPERRMTVVEGLAMERPIRWIILRWVID